MNFACVSNSVGELHRKSNENEMLFYCMTDLCDDEMDVSQLARSISSALAV